MNAVEALRDLDSRLVEAGLALDTLAVDGLSADRLAWLAGKVDGLALARSYIDDALHILKADQ